VPLQHAAAWGLWPSPEPQGTAIVAARGRGAISDGACSRSLARVVSGGFVGGRRAALVCAGGVSGASTPGTLLLVSPPRQ